MADTVTAVPKPDQSGRGSLSRERHPQGRADPACVRHRFCELRHHRSRTVAARRLLGPFRRMRKNDPVHYCPDSPFGPYWSVTRYQDIMTVDTTHGVFSSEGGITVVDQDEDFRLPMFIAMDPPKHDVQRKTVQSIVGPDNLKSFESLIRSRTSQIFDALDVSQAVRLGRQGLDRAHHHDAGDAVRLPVRGSPQAHALVGRRHRPQQSGHRLRRGAVARRTARMPRLLHAAVERARQRRAEGRPHLHAGPWRAHAEHEPAGISRKPHPADRRRQRHHAQFDDRRRLRHEQMARPVREAEGRSRR